MKKQYEGKLLGKGLKFGVVISRINEFITNRMLNGAQDAFSRYGVSEDDVEVVWVPGAFEIPLAASKMAKTKKYDAIICLGAIISRGTPHATYIGAEVTRNIAKVGLESGLPVIHGIITADNIEQAIERAGTKMGNRGFDSVVSAIEMTNLLKSLE